jgi:hypothetical protein
MTKRKGLLGIVLIAVVVIAAGLGYYLFQSRSTSNAPTITSTAPVYSATNSLINTKILVTFSTAMDPTTITTTTFTLKHGTTSDTGNVGYVGVTAIFVPQPISPLTHTIPLLLRQELRTPRATH